MLVQGVSMVRSPPPPCVHVHFLSPPPWHKHRHTHTSADAYKIQNISHLSHAARIDRKGTKFNVTCRKPSYSKWAYHMTVYIKLLTLKIAIIIIPCHPSLSLSLSLSLSHILTCPSSSKDLLLTSAPGAL